MRLIALALFLVSLESLGQLSVPNLPGVGQVGGAMNQRSSQTKNFRAQAANLEVLMVAPLRLGPLMPRRRFSVGNKYRARVSGFSKTAFRTGKLKQSVLPEAVGVTATTFLPSRTSPAVNA